MTILFRTQGINVKGGVVEARYFNSASSLAKSIEGGYIRPYLEGNSHDIHYEVKVFSDIPGEIEKFNHEVFYNLMEEYQNGFSFQEEPSLSHRGRSSQDLLIEDEKKAVRTWQRGLAKASKEYRDRLTQAIEACYP